MYFLGLIPMFTNQVMGPMMSSIPKVPKNVCSASFLLLFLDPGSISIRERLIERDQAVNGMHGIYSGEREREKERRPESFHYYGSHICLEPFLICSKM